MSVVPWDADANVDKMAEVVRQIGWNFPWVQMIVFHELVVPGVVQFVTTQAGDTRRRSAQPVPGPLSDRLCRIAREANKWLVPGSLYETAGNAVYNTALAISPQGEVVAKYRKMFPWLPFESESTAGDEFCVFDVPEAGRFGLCICYDSWFPEVVRSLAWMGAEVILHPTLSSTSDRALELVLNQANAIFNQCYFIDINGAGPWGGGSSLFVDPDGRVLQQAGDHEMVLTEILDLDNVCRAREFGTLGLCQTWKQLRDFGGQFPIYRDGIAAGQIFHGLGKLQFHRSLRRED